MMVDKFNLLNGDNIASYAKTISRGSPKHVVDWFESTFVKHFKQSGENAIQCTSSVMMRDPMIKLMLKLFNAEKHKVRLDELAQLFHVIEDVSILPDWAQTALTKNELWYWVRPERDSEVDIMFRHWVDYARTLPERDIRMTVDQMILQVATWDKQLAKQKLIASLSEGVEEVELPQFESLPGVYLVKLLTQTAYNNESAVMRHCVKSYWGRKNTKIFSLRKRDEDRPLATIELYRQESKRTPNTHLTGVKLESTISIQQVRGFANRAVDQVYLDVIQAWALSHNYVYDPYFNDGDEDEDADDGEDEEEEDDGEEYEDADDGEEEDADDGEEDEEF